MKTRIRHTRTEPVAPVAGGMYWLSPYFGPIDLLRDGLDVPENPLDAPGGQEAPRRESEGSIAPHMLSAPPLETSAREEYVYQPRAYDSNCSGFIWYLEKAPHGMSVDRHSGKVSWTPSKGGYAEIALCARTIYGTTARQCWRLCIRKALVVRTPVFNKRFSEALRRKAARSPSPVRACWREGRRRIAVESLPATAPPGTLFRADIPLRI